MSTEENSAFVVYLINIINELGGHVATFEVILVLVSLIFSFLTILGLNNKPLRKLLSYLKRKETFYSLVAYKVISFIGDLATGNMKKFRVLLMVITLGAGVANVFASLGANLSELGQSVSPSLIAASLILCLTILCIVLSIKFAPRKLFISMGATIAFVFAAFLFEGFLFVVEFIESTNAS